MGFFQATTAHCEADALAHIKRDNPNAESIELESEGMMEFGNLTVYRFEVTMPERRVWEVTPYAETPMFYATEGRFNTVVTVRNKTAAGWA